MARYDVQTASGHVPNNAVVPALVNPPVIFIAPAARTVSSGEIWIAVSCDDPDYGGCIIHASNDDGESYHRIGFLRGSSVQGVLRTALPAAAGLDTTHTLAVDVSASRGVIESPGQVSLETYDSLCFVGNEFLAFKTATAIDVGVYDLTYLERGLYGSDAGAYSGDPFVICDGRVFKYPFNANLVGHTIRLKFQGFNGSQKGLQELSDLVAYAFTVTSDGGTKALISDLEDAIAMLPEGQIYTVVIESTNGTTFRRGLSTTSILKAHAFRNGVEVTDDISQYRFRWRRVSILHKPAPNDDATWNALYESGYKQITIGIDDIDAQATFFCDILTP